MSQEKKGWDSSQRETNILSLWMTIKPQSKGHQALLSFPEEEKADSIKL